MDLLRRTATALILLGLVFVWVQFLPPLWFFLFLQILIVAALVEFYNLSLKRELFPQRVFGAGIALLIGSSFFFGEISLGMALFLSLLFSAFYFLIAFNTHEKLTHFSSSIALTFFGAFYLSFTLNFFYLLREERGRYSVYFLLAVIFLGDSGAYFIGKLGGRHKQFPVASPNKTWEGSLGGFLFAVLGAFASERLFLQEVPLWKAILCGILVHAVAQVSDPLESLFKRAAGVKDSSHILPGHGGFLDRIDSEILAAPFFYYFIQYFW